MTCPEIDTIIQFLLARNRHATSTENASMAQHLAKCQACKAEATAWSRILQTMSAISLERSATDAQSHLDENDLAEYLEGVVGASDRRRIEGHLGGCRECVQRLTGLHELLDLAAPAPTVASFVLRWFEGGLEVLRESLKNVRVVTITPQPVLRPPMERRNAVACAATLGEGEVVTTVQRHEDGLYSCTLHLTGTNLSGDPVTVSLYADGELSESHTLHADSYTFFDLPPAAYRFQVETADAASSVDITIEV